MDSSNQSREIFDLIREKWVKRTPEEEVRQSLVYAMIHQFGYPKGRIAVEKQISQLCSAPNGRRLDIICFDKAGSPLLIIECKASEVTEEAKAQIIGYNAYIKAPYLCIASPKNVVTGSFDEDRGEYVFSPGFLHYKVAK